MQERVCTSVELFKNKEQELILRSSSAMHKIIDIDNDSIRDIVKRDRDS